MLGSLQNQVAIVTGGSRGIGRGIARVLAKAGANVLVAGLEENECREAAEELRSFGVEAEGIAGGRDEARFLRKNGAPCRGTLGPPRRALRQRRDFPSG